MKKQTLVLNCFITTLFFFSLCAQVPEKEDPAQLGLHKLKEIMLNSTNGLDAAYQKNPELYADVQNVSEDIALTEIIKTFPCHTPMCSLFLEEALKHPFNNKGKEHMLSSQAFIRLLVENPSLKADVETLLKNAQNEIPSLVALLSDFVKDTDGGIQQKDPSEKYDSYSSKFRSTIRIIEYINKSTLPLSFIIGLPSFPRSLFFKAIGADRFNYQPSFIPYIISNTAVGSISWLYFSSLKKDYSEVKEKRTQLHALHTLIKIKNELQTIQKEHYHYTDIFFDQKSPNRLNIEHMIGHKRYADKESFACMPPSIYRDMYTLYKHEKELSATLNIIGEIDALHAIATRIVEQRETAEKICFTTPSHDQEISIKNNDFWNVLVQKGVINSLDENKNIILTGPNAGGKTTTIRSILFNILLHQRFGVSTGSYFKSCIFDLIHSYLSLSDNILEGDSLFVSHLKTAQTILKKGREGQIEGKNSFFALDELFSSTGEQQGAECAYNYIKNIAQKFHTMRFIYATHFDVLPELAKDPSAHCQNYKMDLIENDDDTIQYLYTLSKGINYTKIALRLAKKAGIFD